MGSRADRISSPASQRSKLTRWVIVLVLPAMTFALVIGLGIFGLLMRLFGA